MVWIEGAFCPGEVAVNGSRKPPKGAGRWYLVSYDVRDPRRLRRVARVLEGHGERVQYSVFRCWLSSNGLERLRWELTENCVEHEDDVIFIPLCSRCAQGISVTHSAVKAATWKRRPKRVRIL